jgi:hypothetical protein
VEDEDAVAVEGRGVEVDGLRRREAAVRCSAVQAGCRFCLSYAATYAVLWRMSETGPVDQGAFKEDEIQGV